MAGYWTRHRLFLTLLISAAVALIGSFLFVYPGIIQQANYYNSQSVYKNTEIDFIAPEPSFEQVDDLPGTNGIKKVFPFFLTKTQVNVNGYSKTTTVLLSDRFENIDLTMYNKARLIEESNTEYDNPILVDWQFCHDTSAGIGDTVSLKIGGEDRQFTICAVYETNSIYEGGAILAQISEAEKEEITQQSNNSGYSGFYISASDYNACRTYLTTEYRPMGRLKDRSQFDDDDQYQVHYDAIMSSGYANEITDFRIREDSLEKNSASWMPWIGAVLAFVILLVFNILMARRGCEEIYFRKQCIPKGKNVKPYYTIAFVFEIAFSLLLFAVLLLVRIKMADDFIPNAVYGISLAAIPVGIIVAEAVSLKINTAKVSGMVKQFELEQRKAKEKKAREEAERQAEEEKGNPSQNK